MSKFYVESDNETTISIFNKRIIYDFESKNENYLNLVDFNFAEKFLYGRVSRTFEPIYLSADSGNLKTFNLNNAEGTPPQAMNFVVDMFDRLSLQFQKCVTIGKISGDDKFLSSLKIFKGYQDPVKLHTSFLQTQLDAFSVQLKNIKYKNVNEFMLQVEGLLLDSVKLYPITFSGFVKSRFCPISVSGLALEIADSDYFNDNGKIEEFINSPNWEFYLNACRSYGFMVDKLIPWRIVADIGTSECLEYSRIYNRITTDSILNNAYGRTDLTFFKKLKFYLLNLYNQNVGMYAEPYECDGVQKTRYVNVPTITIEQFDKQISEIKLLNFYFKVRMMEEDKLLTTGDSKKLMMDCSNIYQKLGLSFALDRFERIINQPFDSTGSLSYINEARKKLIEER